MPNTHQRALLAVVVLTPLLFASPQAYGQGSAIKHAEHYAVRDGLKIYLWEKWRASDEGTFSQTGKIALLVHGATWSGRPDFDLQVRDYSLMDYLAARGYDVFAIDIHGYGHSDKTDADWSPAATAALDIDAAADFIRAERQVDKINVLGWSWGCQTAGLFAMQHPEKVRRLILYAPTWKPRANAETAAKLPEEQYRINTREAAASDFIEGCYDADAARAYVDACLETDPRSPNGVIVDMRTRLPILDPERIRVPVMIFFGEHEFPDKADQIIEFFRLLGAGDKQLIVLPGGGHAIMLEKPHLRVFHIFTSYFDTP